MSRVRTRLLFVATGLALTASALIPAWAPAWADEPRRSREGWDRNAARAAAAILSSGAFGEDLARVAGAAEDVANVASVIQDGPNQSSAIRQTGEGNVGAVRQYGRDNSGRITQQGNHNTACLIQFGRGLSGDITQVGDGQSRGVIQTRRGSQEVPAELCLLEQNRGALQRLAGRRR